MGGQAADTDALRSATEALSSMVNYSTALQTGASAFANMLPGEWQGPAAARFLTAFETWALSATALTEASVQLQSHASAVLSAYETGISTLDSDWDTYRSALGA